MANTTAVYARIDTGLKEHAEAILSQLGISPSSAMMKGLESLKSSRAYSADEVDAELHEEFGI